MGEFTPGPWAYRPQEYDDWGIVRMAGRDEDGFQQVICQANYVADPTELCKHRANGTDPAEANARLIAAAPELLDIAERMMEVIEFAYMGAPEQPKEIAQYRAIRAKILKP